MPTSRPTPPAPTRVTISGCECTEGPRPRFSHHLMALYCERCDLELLLVDVPAPAPAPRLEVVR